MNHKLKINKEDKFNIPLNKITRWGMYREVIMELIVDSLLKNIQYPEANKFRQRIPNYYLEKKAILDKAQYSLIRVTSEHLANELYLRIKEKESTFEEIAKKYSEGPEKQTEGNIGPESIGKAHSVLAKLLQISEKGQIWPPKKVDKWWIIVRLNYFQKSSLDKSMFKNLALELGFKYLDELINEQSYDNLHKLLE